MIKAWLPALALLLPACGQTAEAPAQPALAVEPANAAEPEAVRFSGADHDGPTRLIPFPADSSPEAREANRRAREAAVGDDELVLHRCTGDRALCARVGPDGARWSLDIVERVGGSERRFRFTPVGTDRPFNPLWFDLWPSLVRERGGAVMVGLIMHRRNVFSGGASTTDRLSLVRLAPGTDAAVEVLHVPLRGWSMVRACFREQDMRLRREACHDEQEFDGTLTVDSAEAAGPPRFAFATRARTYPGRVFRLTDEEIAARERRQFARRDLVWVQDPECSYRRLFTFDAAAGRYAPEALLPDCSDYLIPAEDQP